MSHSGTGEICPGTPARGSASTPPRSGTLASDISVPSVAASAMSGTAIPVRCRAPPSSSGAGIFDQSTSLRLGWFGETIWLFLSEDAEACHRRSTLPKCRAAPRLIVEPVRSACGGRASMLRPQMIPAADAEAEGLIKGDGGGVGGLGLEVEIGAALGGGPYLDGRQHGSGAALSPYACQGGHALHRGEVAVGNRQAGANHGSSAPAREVRPVRGQAGEDDGRHLAPVWRETREIDGEPVGGWIGRQADLCAGTRGAVDLLHHRRVVLALLVAHCGQPRVDVAGLAHLGDG